MQPRSVHVPPSRLSFSTIATFKPNCPARIAATYPPGPLPITVTSNCSLANFGKFLSNAVTQPVRLRTRFRKLTACATFLDHLKDSHYNRSLENQPIEDAGDEVSTGSGSDRVPINA